MIKKPKKVIIILLFLSISIGLTGCTTTTEDEKQDNANQSIFLNISLVNITLTEEDMPSSYLKVSEKHNTTNQTVEDITGNGLSWSILEQYDVTFYANITNGVMESLIKFKTSEEANNLTILSKNNMLKSNYTLQSIDQIGDISFLLNRTITYENNQSQYYTLLFSKDNIFVALGGATPEKSTFVSFAKTIEQNIIDEIEKEENESG